MSDAPHESGGECRGCPVCAVLQILREVNPEVGERLATAARELALAVRAVLGPERERGVRWASPTDRAAGDGRSHDEAANGTAATPAVDEPAPGAAGTGAAEATAPRRLRRIEVR